MQQDGKWAWTDKTAMTFTSWDDDKPDIFGKCMSMSKNSRWNNQKCNILKHRFICKISKLFLSNINVSN